MIVLKNICKKFGTHSVLTDFSLHIERNEFVCIVGASGSGKTTLLNIIGLLDKADSGEIIINGKSHFTGNEIRLLRQQFFGYIFQNYMLMNEKTVEDNFNVSNYGHKKFKKEELIPVMNELGLDDSFLNNKVYQLSGGEQQKVAIGRMMLKPYELVLADEPTGNLDEKSRDEIIGIFKKLKAAGKTIICVTHDKKVAKAADRIITIDD